ncbi:MAG: hypothetical protein NTX87_00355 [Planctomycetota bacterium]|nr:hypothetical protein [Planctomycetota bacterium]
MTDLQAILFGLLSRHCRGPASPRKLWKIGEDLRALGLDAEPQAILDALAALRRQGFPVMYDGDPPAAYIEERPRGRARAEWRTGRRPRRMAHATRQSAAGRALAEAERIYLRFLDAAMARAQAAAPPTASPVGAAEAGRGRPRPAQASAPVRGAASGRRRGQCLPASAAPMSEAASWGKGGLR